MPCHKLSKFMNVILKLHNFQNELLSEANYGIFFLKYNRYEWEAEEFPSFFYNHTCKIG